MTGGKRYLDLLDHHDAIAELWRTCQACGLRWRVDLGHRCALDEMKR